MKDSGLIKAEKFKWKDERISGVVRGRSWVGGFTDSGDGVKV